jgi:hypothetical protein
MITTPTETAMLKRPLNPRFSQAVLHGRKFTTIRKKPWPTSVPIMLYNWSAAAYRSPQIDVAAVIVESASPITITRIPSDQLLYQYSTGGDERLVCLWSCEGFEDGHEMDDWFRRIVKPGQVFTAWLLKFSRVNAPAVATAPKDSD